MLKSIVEVNIEGRLEVTGRLGRRSKQLLEDVKEKERVLEIESGSSRSHCVEKSVWKRLWTCCKTDCEVNE